MKKYILIATTISACALMISPALAGGEYSSYEPPGSVVPFSDVEGNFEKIVSVGEAFSDSNSAEDVESAIRAASLRAKAGLSKFLCETTGTEEQLLEMSNRLKEQGIDGEKVTKQRLRVQLETIKSQSTQILKALVKLEDCYDADRGAVMVKLGTNLRLLDVASQAKKLFEDNTDSASSSSSDDGSYESESTTDGFNRKSSVSDNF